MNPVAIVAPGAQLTASEVRAVVEAGVPAIAVSDAYKLFGVNELVAIYASDEPWWEYHLPRIQRHFELAPPPMWTQEAGFAARNHENGVRWLEHNAQSKRWQGASTCVGSSSGHHALCLAAALGYDHIALLGYEYGAAGDTHFCGSHPQGIARPSNWRVMVKDMGPLAVSLAERGIRVSNCTRTTALRCFNQVRFEDFLEENKRETSKTRRRSRHDADNNPASAIGE